MRISVTIITLNEERNIARCIDSILPLADEVLVMDAGSTDNTIALCHDRNVTVISQPWLGYGAQKNKINALATSEMILSLDADEAVSERLKESILKLKKDGKVGYYTMNRLTNYCGQWIHYSGWNPDIKLRLFPKNARWSDALVHEEVLVPKDEVITHLEGSLEHYSYYSMEEHLSRANQYSSLTAQKYNQQGRTCSVITPWTAAIGRFVKMYFLKKGFLDGRNGFHIARISAKSNFFKYSELRRLNREKR
ncbi:MAG: glycosyltransferase family 2 protein [Flavobacteriales bacterium]